MVEPSRSGVARPPVSRMTDGALLVEDAGGDPRVPLSQDPERVPHRCARHLEAHLARAARERAQEAGELEGDRHTRAARTQTTGGRPAASAVQESPSSREAKSLPLRVPK